MPADVKAEAAGFRRRRVRRLLGALLLACAVALVSGAWYLSDDLRCPTAPEASTYGDAEWGWFPIGTTCRWSEADHGLDRVEEPGWVPTILIAAMVITGFGLVLSGDRASRRSTLAATRSSDT